MCPLPSSPFHFQSHWPRTVASVADALCTSKPNLFARNAETAMVALTASAIGWAGATADEVQRRPAQKPPLLSIFPRPSSLLAAVLIAPEALGGVLFPQREKKLTLLLGEESVEAASVRMALEMVLSTLADGEADGRRQ